MEMREEWVGLILPVGPLASEVTLGLTIAVWEMGGRTESPILPFVTGVYLTVDIQGPCVAYILTGAGGD